MGLNQPPKIQTSHKLLRMSLFLKKISGGGKKFLIMIWKRRNIFLQDRKFVMCYLCLLLPRKKTAGKFFINTFLTSPGLKELL